MNLHEYQGKELLNSFGVRIQRGIVADNHKKAVEAAKQLASETGTSWFVVKAQIHAGGRGKGGGVKLAKNLAEVETISENIIGMMLKTPQTPPQGKKVHQVLIAEDVYYPGDNEPEEYYMSVLLNRGTGRNMIMYSTEGGMDIEAVAEKTPHLIFTEDIDPLIGIQAFQARKIAFNLGLSGNALKEMIKFVTSLYTAFVNSDASLFEINPVLKTSDDKILAVDGDKIETFSEISEKVLFGKEILIERNGSQSTVTMPEDFLSQLLDSKEKGLISLRQPFVVVQVPDTSYNKSSGLKKGDIILGLNDYPTKYTDEVKIALEKLKGQNVIATVKRDKEQISVPLVVSDDALLGLVVAGASTPATLEALGYYNFDVKDYGFLESFPVGLNKAKDKLVSYWDQLGAIFTPSTGAYKGVGGFKAIYDIFPSFWSWQVFWSITAFLSIMLGVLNLLPIPALDGGHVMFLLYEMISGRKPGDKFMEYAQMVGFFLLIALVLFANGNDIYKAIFG